MPTLEEQICSAEARRQEAQDAGDREAQEAFALYEIHLIRERHQRAGSSFAPTMDDFRLWLKSLDNKTLGQVIKSLREKLQGANPCPTSSTTSRPA